MPELKIEEKEIENLMRSRASELLRDGSVFSVLGWEQGEFCYDPTPAFFDSEIKLNNLVYNGFASPMLSKYLINAVKNLKDANSKILVFLRPCDTYGLNTLIKEHRVERDKVYVIGVKCNGLLDMNKLKTGGVKNLRSVEYIKDEDIKGEENIIAHTLSGDLNFNQHNILLEKCLSCKNKEFMICDEILPVSISKEASEASKKEFENKENKKENNRFSFVAKLESMSPEERFNFWRGELSRCIRCNACRNSCPVCSCNTCVFDNLQSGVRAKVNSDSFEENMFHIIRAFHVAGRCSDCGECSRVCPQHIPLHLLNRKFIKDINAFYGEFQAGVDTTAKSPLMDYRFDDVEPGVSVKASVKGGGA